MTEENNIQYLSQDKLDQLKKELDELKKTKIPALAKRIDDARQMGDLSENAEYHAAREDMAWAQGRMQEIEAIIGNATVISGDGRNDGVVQVGSTIVVKIDSIKKEYTIVGPQEADPLHGKISNESPLGEAFLGKRQGEKVEVKVPAGVQNYKILEVK